VYFLLALTSALGQQTEPAPAAALPAAGQSEVDCSGFISAQPIFRDLYVFEGADNDLHGLTRNWATGDFVFLRSRSGGGYTVGNEFSLVRSGKDLMRFRWYNGQGSSVRSLGEPYEDVGRLKVVRATQYGAIAEITFACGPVTAGDLAIPLRTRGIPTFTPTAQFDRFAPPNNKLLGTITAGVTNTSFFGAGSMAYINLGSSDGVAPGQKFRIFHIIRDTAGGGLTIPPEPPREIIGELVVLTTEEKSSVAMVVRSTRQIALRDGIELE
jgi:hypothetical protein